ncbi:beta-ketoacyl-ACP synthase III [Myxococcota bacterium]
MSLGRGSRIVGIGSYAPQRVVTNLDLEQLVDTSDQWITERTGVKERRVAEPGQASSDLAWEASVRALEMAHLTAADLDMVIVGTITPDHPLPACASVLHQRLGAKDIPAFDVSAACAGFIYGLSVADQFIRTGMCDRVLVVGVEMLSKVVNWQDRNTCVLFGDGAGAVVLVPAEHEGGRVLSSRLYTDSSLIESLWIPAGGSREPVTAEALAAQRNKVRMVGSDVFRVAVRNLTAASRSALAAAGLGPERVDWMVPHQANLRIINQVAQRLGIPRERFVLNIDRYGNTSSASIPIALDEGVRDGRVRPGHTVLMCALGAGVSWASALVRM